ncbi:MAG TPA: hypothetical protein VI248_20875 [Kineosporiaceae bacterium]
MTASVQVAGDQVIVDLGGGDPAAGVPADLRIPLASVRAAYADAELAVNPGPAVVGRHLPGHLVTGTFRTSGERVLWNVRDPAKSVIIELAEHRYARLIIEVDDPEATVALVLDAIRPPADRHQ